MLLDILQMIGSALFMVFFFGACIFIHELGHFLAARMCGLHIVAFSIGFRKAWAKKINGVELQTFCREVQNARTEIEVEAGTTGFKGGCCRDKGARAFLAIDCNQGDFFFDPKRDENGRVVGIAIACCGDDALASLIDTLGFAMKAIIDQCDETDE